MGGDQGIMSILGAADFVALTETGSDGPSGPHLPGYTCIHVMPRENGNRGHTHTGGVALFVRERLSARVSVARKHEALGIMWARVGPPPGSPAAPVLHVAVCYMPHGASKIYRNGAGDLATQWATLQADLLDFCAAGEVVLMGDFNAHTCTERDVPADTSNSQLACIPTRASMDAHAVNRMGRHLLETCQRFGLVILNGRLPGDESGHTTHSGNRGGQGSLLDYIIVSPKLAFCRNGAPLPRTWLRVVGGGDMNNLPPKPETRARYDHAPVMARLRLVPAGAGSLKKDQPDGEQPKTTAVRWAWRPELQQAWTEQLSRVGALTACEGLDSMPSGQSISTFTQTLSAQVAALHEKEKRVIVRKTSAPMHRPTNGWYNESCAEARRAYKDAIGAHGEQSEAAKSAHRTYKQTCARTRASFEVERQESLVRDLYSNPRAFWKTFKSEARADAPISTTQWTDYFRKMFQANTAGDYVGGSIETHCTHHQTFFPKPSPRAKALAACLNTPFTNAEVQVALAKLPNHKAAGVDGMPAEFLTQAWVSVQNEQGKWAKHYILGPYLAQLFTSILCGVYPEEWGTSALAPVPKAGGLADDPNDYRGIAVGPVLAKLYSLCLSIRLDAWAEKNGLRARGQAGFREGRSTMDNTFILRHLTESAEARGKPLYTAFIDFSKAYDRIDRALLWQVLEGCGMHGETLATLKQMYSRVRMQVRCKGELGETFEAGVGVKQGCPLSPLLFGIYLDRFESYLDSRCPGEGAELGGAQVRALFYADDIVIVSDTAAGLQRMLDAMHEFCQANSMFVNSKKSEVVIFGREGPVGGSGDGGSAGGPGVGPFNCGSNTLAIKPSYKYLGLIFEAQQRLAGALDRAIGKATKSARSVHGKCFKLRLHNPDLQARMFDTLVQPVLCFGCEVWGPDLAADATKNCKILTGTAADREVHLPFLRQTLGVGTQTPTAPLLLELGRQPIAAFWIRMAAKLWNRALSRAPNDFLLLALQANLREAKRPGLEKKGMWAFEFTACLRNLGLQSAWGTPSQPKKLDLKALDKSIQDLWGAQQDRGIDARAGGLAVRAVPDEVSKGFQSLTYRRLFQPGKWVRKHSLSYHLQNHDLIRVLAKFRLGMHGLAVQADRMRAGQEKTVRSNRRCPCCKTSREDEMHMLLECPAYSEHRAGHADWFAEPRGGWTDQSFNDRFNHETREGWEGLARFLMACFKTRSEIVDSVSAGAPRGRTQREGPRN